MCIIHRLGQKSKTEEGKGKKGKTCYMGSGVQAQGRNSCLHEKEWEVQKVNKVILMGRLVKDPEIRYSQGPEQIAVGRYTLAVNCRGKDGEADFIPCIVFGKSATFAEKYFAKGQMVAVVGKIQVRNWTDKGGNKRWTTEVIVEEQHFTGGKEAGQQPSKPKSERENAGFYPIDESIEDDDLPF